MTTSNGTCRAHLHVLGTHLRRWWCRRQTYPEYQDHAMYLAVDTVEDIYHKCTDALAQSNEALGQGQQPNFVELLITVKNIEAMARKVHRVFPCRRGQDVVPPQVPPGLLASGNTSGLPQSMPPSQPSPTPYHASNTPSSTPHHVSDTMNDHIEEDEVNEKENKEEDEGEVDHKEALANCLRRLKMARRGLPPQQPHDEGEGEEENLLRRSKRVCHPPDRLSPSGHKQQNKKNRRSRDSNGQVINLYLELLKERQTREPDKFLKCHFFNTHFYPKLPRNESTRRWTSYKTLGYRLAECEKIFVPVHNGRNHWSLIAIDMKYKTIHYLDSLRLGDNGALELMARYITNELKEDTSTWTKEKLSDIPLQENGSDCGMFMVKYIDFLSSGLKPSFCQENMSYFRRRTAKEILALRAD